MPRRASRSTRRSGNPTSCADRSAGGSPRHRSARQSDGRAGPRLVVRIEDDVVGLRLERRFARCDPCRADSPYLAPVLRRERSHDGRFRAHRSRLTRICTSSDVAGAAPDGRRAPAERTHRAEPATASPGGGRPAHTPGRACPSALIVTQYPSGSRSENSTVPVFAFTWGSSSSRSTRARARRSALSKSSTRKNKRRPLPGCA